MSSVEDQTDENEKEITKLVSIQAQDATVNILCVYNVTGGSGVSVLGEEQPASAGEGREDIAGREGEAGTEGKGREEETGGSGGGGSGEAEEVGKDEVEKDESLEEKEARRRLLSEVDFGSCYVALTVNNRLLILQVPHRYSHYTLYMCGC